MKKIILTSLLVVLSFTSFANSSFQGQDQNGKACSLSITKEAGDDLMIKVQGEKLSGMFKVLLVGEQEYLYESSAGNKETSLYLNLNEGEKSFSYYSKGKVEQLIECHL